MDWGKVLGAANVGISLMNSLALDDLREQGERAVAEQRLQELLRNRIFTLRQSAEAVLAAIDGPPKQQAAAMKILEWQASDAMLKPEKFRELSDKEYVHTTGKRIREAAAVLYTQLPESEQTEVTEIIAVYNRLPEYDVYLSQYSTQRQLQSAKKIVALYGWRNGSIGCLLVPIVVFLPQLVVTALFGGRVSNNDGMELVILVWFLCSFGGVVMFRLWTHQREFVESRKVISKLKDAEENAVEFARLHERFSSDTQARSMQQDDKERIRAFFGNANMLLN